MAEYVTKSGKVLTEADIEKLVIEAEEGYDVRMLKPRPLKSSTSCRICGHWIEGDWNTAPRGPEGDEARAKAEREMRHGCCDKHLEPING